MIYIKQNTAGGNNALRDAIEDSISSVKNGEYVRLSNSLEINQHLKSSNLEEGQYLIIRAMDTKKQAFGLANQILEKLKSDGILSKGNKLNLADFKQIERGFFVVKFNLCI